MNKKPYRQRISDHSRPSQQLQSASAHILSAQDIIGLGTAASEYEGSLPASAPEKIVATARSQLGKPYDWTAIAGLGLRRNWRQDDAWFCSELVAWVAAAAGEPWFRCEALRRVMPQHLWMLHPLEDHCTLRVAKDAKSGTNLHTAIHRDRYTAESMKGVNT